MSQTKLSLAGNNLIFPGQGELGTRKWLTFFYIVWAKCKTVGKGKHFLVENVNIHLFSLNIQKQVGKLIRV
jgi:hypothetical protein